MGNQDHLAVVTTVGSRAAARRLARELVEAGLAACAQISEIESIYRWQNEIEEDREFRVLLKSRAALYDDLEAAILERHDYELPAIHAFPFARAHAPYTEWIDASTPSGGFSR